MLVKVLEMVGYTLKIRKVIFKNGNRTDSYVYLVRIDIFKCFVCLQSEKLSEFVQGAKTPFPGLLHAQNGDCSKAPGDIVRSKST